MRLKRGGMLRRSWSVSGRGFRVKFQYDGALVVWFKTRTNLFSHRFGHGWVFTGTTIDKLELRLDDEGQFRWYRYPGAVSRSGFVHGLRHAHWFPLTAEYITESLAA